MRFLANYKYSIKRNVTSDPLHAYKKLAAVVKDTEEDAKNNFNSICNTTMVGFVQDMSVNGSMTHHNITCFFAEVDPKFVIEETEGSL